MYHIEAKVMTVDENTLPADQHEWPKRKKRRILAKHKSYNAPSPALEYTSPPPAAEHTSDYTSGYTLITTTPTPQYMVAM